MEETLEARHRWPGLQSLAGLWTGLHQEREVGTLHSRESQSEDALGFVPEQGTNNVSDKNRRPKATWRARRASGTPLFDVQ
ncbi:Hypothetical predicted protein [Marmota monax]|uniref:Uncharacterized protein n=1 Tax=Marmota monax TaxID=9995 RepID=A0A5E4CPZ9_MARMO|nr:hypothetical protein GHT09_003484 [Marmota monax]VTJ83856.1 Hypothetical predicted protein [Marmota monax]